MAVPAGFEPA